MKLWRKIKDKNEARVSKDLANIRKEMTREEAIIAKSTSELAALYAEALATRDPAEMKVGQFIPVSGSAVTGISSGSDTGWFTMGKNGMLIPLTSGTGTKVTVGGLSPRGAIPLGIISNTASEKPTQHKEPIESKMTLQEQLTACAAAKVFVLLMGRPGISKSTTATEIGKKIAADAGKPFFSIVLPEDTPVAELRGHYMPNAEGGFSWHDGPVTHAVREGGVLLLDELSHLSPEATTFLHAALDGSDLTLPTGETVKKHPGLWVVATQNDEAEILRPAIMDRFGVRITLKMPPRTALNALPDDLGQLAFDEAKTGKGSLRPWFAYARLREVIDHREAAMLVWPKVPEAIERLLGKAA